MRSSPKESSLLLRADQSFGALRADKGLAQAEALAPVLAEVGVEALVSSPFARAVATLQPFAEAQGLPIAVDEGLRERNLAAGWLPDAAAAEEAIRRMHADLSYCLQERRERPSDHRPFRGRPGEGDRHPSRPSTVAVGSHGGVISHLLARHRDDLKPQFWTSIRNPHLFVFDCAGEPRWIAERTLDGAPGVRNW